MEIPWSISHGIPWNLHGKFHVFSPWNSMGYKTATVGIPFRGNTIARGHVDARRRFLMYGLKKPSSRTSHFCRGVVAVAVPILMHREYWVRSDVMCFQASSSTTEGTRRNTLNIPADRHRNHHSIMFSP